ncbi:hypothetical protein PUNSTDRAFT_47382 [Punctularia strigosozonata HHB-11173 SS5]|uniref:Uncharacterized protein n=1 Tax=Punctularia strigosozonata (strain HHB-11173) TaxID=741275 RepID=R7S4N9_PUNST|nr:uncharacterized protein PUNSTDRAFT_47382 [Punctularia strigosozonata HHB-11173 SS5]EIN04752.1 hypothetical protein PUNSTDRAFT_47382 [Punctularia strigosozonata HHB-11173 SS5]
MEVFGTTVPRGSFVVKVNYSLPRFRELQALDLRQLHAAIRADLDALGRIPYPAARTLQHCPDPPIMGTVLFSWNISKPLLQSACPKITGADRDVLFRRHM